MGEQTSDDEEDEEESSSTNTTSSGWSIESRDDGFGESDNEKQTFTKLDEFTLEKQETEWFDECQRAHDEALGAEGKACVQMMMDAKHIVGVDFVSDCIVEKWKKCTKQRIKPKEQKLTS